MILYHGSPNRIVYPSFGLGDDRHDYGKGFYLTQDLNLAKEWAVCRPETESGYVHTYQAIAVFDDFHGATRESEPSAAETVTSRNRALIFVVR